MLSRPEFMLLCLLGISSRVIGQSTNASTPEQLVQQQIDAWNQHNAERFATPYSDTTRLYTFPNSLVRQFSNRQELQQYYGQFFAQHPNVHCDVINTLAVGNTVILAEKVTGRADGWEINSIVTYKIEANKITRVYFDYRP